MVNISAQRLFMYLSWNTYDGVFLIICSCQINSEIEAIHGRHIWAIIQLYQNNTWRTPILVLRSNSYKLSRWSNIVYELLDTNKIHYESTVVKHHKNNNILSRFEVLKWKQMFYRTVYLKLYSTCFIFIGELIWIFKSNVINKTFTNSNVNKEYVFPKIRHFFRMFNISTLITHGFILKHIQYIYPILCSMTNNHSYS